VLVAHRLATECNAGIDLDALGQLLDDHRSIRGVAITYCDTSTGVLNDVAAICRVTRQRNILSLVDGVSAIGGMPFAFDEWEPDVAITASQKCLMSSPGLAFAAVSDRAWHARASSRLPHRYLHFEERSGERRVRRESIY